MVIPKCHWQLSLLSLTMILLITLFLSVTAEQVNFIIYLLIPGYLKKGAD